MSDSLKIFDTAILIGFNPEGGCVYSEQMEFGDYYDTEHVWDGAEEIRKLQLQKVRGFLFGSDGTLEQEFESYFNLETGIYEKGWARFADGTFREDKPKA